MAYTKVTPFTPTVAGTTTSYSAPSGAGAGNGDSVPVGSVISVNNASGSPITVTLNIPITYEGYTITSPTVTVAAGTTVDIGPLNGDPFGVTSGTDENYVHVDYSSITTVTRKVTLQGH